MEFIDKQVIHELDRYPTSYKEELEKMLDSKQILKNTVVDLQKTFEGKLEPEYIEKYIKATAEWLDDVSKWSINYVDFVDNYLSGYGSGDMWYDFARYGKYPHFNRYEEVFYHISPLTDYGDTRCQFIEEELSADNIQNEDLKDDFLELVDNFENEYYEAIQRNKIAEYINNYNNTIIEIEKSCKELIKDGEFFDMPSIDKKIFEELQGREEYPLRDYFEDCVLDEVGRELIKSDKFYEEFVDIAYDYYSEIEEVLHDAVEELRLIAWKSGYCYRNECDYYFELTPELESKIVDKFKENDLSDCNNIRLYDISCIMEELDVENDDIYCLVPFTLTGVKESLENKKQWLQLADTLEQVINEYGQENDYIM